MVGREARRWLWLGAFLLGCSNVDQGGVDGVVGGDLGDPADNLRRGGEPLPLAGQGGGGAGGAAPAPMAGAGGAGPVAGAGGAGGMAMTGAGGTGGAPVAGAGGTMTGAGGGPPPVTTPPPPAAPVVLRAKDVKGKRVLATTIYAKEVQAKVGSVTNPRVSEQENAWQAEVGSGTIDLPEVRADVIYAEKVDCENLQATTVFAQKIQIEKGGGRGDEDD